MPEEPGQRWRTHDHRASACHCLHLRLCGLAWGLLGGSLMVRTGESDNRFSREVALLWGGNHVQVAPRGPLERPRTVTERIQDRDAQGRPSLAR